MNEIKLSCWTIHREDIMSIAKRYNLILLNKDIDTIMKSVKKGVEWALDDVWEEIVKTAINDVDNFDVIGKINLLDVKLISTYREGDWCKKEYTGHIEIVNIGIFEFYLESHNGAETNIINILDESSFTDAEIKLITDILNEELCTLYMNNSSDWNKGIN